MSFACRPNFSSVFVVQPLPGGNSTGGGLDVGTQQVTLTFAAAGTVAASGTGVGFSFSIGPVSHNWSLAGAQPDYYVRATLTAGSLNAGTTGSWLQLNSDRTWQVLKAVNGTQAATLTMEIATDAAGANIVSSGVYDISVTRAPP